MREHLLYLPTLTDKIRTGKSSRNLNRPRTMSTGKKPDRHWRQLSAPFQEQYREYDAWFDDNPLFPLEVATLKAVKTTIEPPELEVGIGPGRFAQRLGVRFGIDPAQLPLTLARDRGALVCRAIGEQLPFGTAVFGAIYLLFSLCFLAKPEVVLRECRRTLKPGGNLIIGLVPALSPWGRMLTKKGENGHPFYRRARLRTIAATLDLLERNNFNLIESRSALFSSPEAPSPVSDHRPGHEEQAGFAVLVARPAKVPGDGMDAHQE
jgi:SAM-dependent methyltransferase